MINRIATALASCSLIAALSLPAFAAPSEDAVTFAKAIAANGCELNEENSSKVQGLLNFDGARGSAAAQSLMAEGLISLTPAGAKLSSDYCIELGGTPAAAEAEAEEPLSEEAVRFVETLESFECRLQASDNEAFLAKAKLSNNEAAEVAMELLSRELVAMENDALVLKTEGCL